jgi:hypothetical protein
MTEVDHADTLNSARAMRKEKGCPAMQDSPFRIFS